MSELSDSNLLDMTTQIVAAYVANNTLGADDLSVLITSVHATMSELSGQPSAPVQTLTPAVPIEDSVQPDHLVCLEDGRELKMLKRYLRSRYNMTPEDYRERWGLPADYPMVAPNYAKLRSRHAKKIGLGRKKDA